MRDGSPGKHGSPGNEESVTYTSPTQPERSNPTLTATKISNLIASLTTWTSQFCNVTGDMVHLKAAWLGVCKTWFSDHVTRKRPRLPAIASVG